MLSSHTINNEPHNNHPYLAYLGPGQCFPAGQTTGRLATRGAPAGVITDTFWWPGTRETCVASQNSVDMLKYKKSIQKTNWNKQRQRNTFEPRKNCGRLFLPQRCWLFPPQQQTHVYVLVVVVGKIISDETFENVIAIAPFEINRSLLCLPDVNHKSTIALAVDQHQSANIVDCSSARRCGNDIEASNKRPPKNELEHQPRGGGQWRQWECNQPVPDNRQSKSFVQLWRRHPAVDPRTQVCYFGRLINKFFNYFFAIE